ncbi:ComEC/Rec2 family competence protein [Pedobacter insulae]|uniref:Competence protein ComEC n=1 Tax=Pedobacter insulae TaxID=414048 RepID=A0A1I2UHC9_9SPHI|nr:ComEC/Rec2 family competence protein [Pedobacter insulae]SFG76433.1 competence protein ComEC [Pedobacter insulae]
MCWSYPIESADYKDIIFFITGGLFLTLCGINVFYTSLRAYRFKHLTGILFSFFLFAFGSTLSLLNNNTLATNYFAKYTGNQLKIWIDNEPQVGNTTVRFTANVTGIGNGKNFEKTIGKLLVIINIDTVIPSKYYYGEELLLIAEHSPIAPPYNPAEFDFQGWLKAKKVYRQVFIQQKSVVKTGFSSGNPLIKYALLLRKAQIAHYNRLLKNKEAFAVASTLILGYRADLSEETLSAYSKTGTIHALSVSGMHVGIIYLVLNWLLGFLERKRSLRILKIILICVLIWFYALLTGFSPSVLRSAIMLTVYIAARSFNQYINSYNILAFTAFCLLIYNPFFIWDVGFQLSFLAVIGLIYLQPKIYKCLYFKYRWANWLWSSISLSVAAQIATFPLSIYYFHQFPVYFMVSNLFILIPITLLMYLGISILLFKLYFLAPIFEWIIIFMNRGLNWIANLPFSGVNQIWISKFELCLLGTALAFGILALVGRKKYNLISALLLCLSLHLSFTLSTIRAKEQRKILFFTLRNGYATAFINRQEAIVVTNLSAKDKNFTFFIQPALDQLKIKNSHLIKWQTDLDYKFFRKKHHQIKFFNHDILLIDSSFNYKSIAKNPAFDMVWLHQNPRIKLADLRKTINFNGLVVDGSNTTFNIKKYVDGAKKINIVPTVLKKNKAYLIDLN